ncbi:hypothetical protein pb186bvf_020597 [Paramecium bursaria]
MNKILKKQNTIYFSLYFKNKIKRNQKMQKEQFDWLVKVILLGDSSVGKTNILTQFCEGRFSQGYSATIGVDFKIKTLQVEEKKIKLQIWDTAGQERFRNITSTYYKGAFGIIFVYSITDRDSFNNVEKWVKSIRENTTEEVCQILVGNKMDLQNRKVEKYEGEALANKFKIQFLETSAKDGTNIQSLFDMLGKDLKKKLEKEDGPSHQKGMKLDGNSQITQDPSRCNC